MPPVDSGLLVLWLFRGYRHESGGAADSDVETSATLRLYIATCRWAGVPFYIPAGKCLPITSTQVVVDLKPPPMQIFDEIPPAHSNYFRLRLSPEVVISTGVRVKRAGDDMRGERSEEHTSELQSLMRISYAVFCLKKKKQNK